ncbi:biopolymer transporter ExbD [Candidatus Phycosocius spiralis]|uniref:Biopolymer transporter ExbD n=1 Tax=Candidatus Phycosocius spiralis TaxID=2815099 RepID=A0ABQ4PTS2_9PROT|nr:biopolymer transporter ExbD [Candidatus Phycosocius spiralis]GIU66385.1 biopolymer transporter ExbD [Candidatus Phycosocius spiralis]
MGAKLAGGGGSSKRGRLDVNAEPNIVPFVDVMLVLLIIFMVASPVASVDIKVDLPNSKVLPSKRPPKPTYISIQDKGGVVGYFVGNDEVTDTTILGKKAFEAVVKDNPKFKGDIGKIIDQRIYVRADGKTPYRNVVFVMNRLQDEGFYKVALVGADKRR